MLVSRTQNQRIKLQSAVTHTYGSELWPQPTFAASTGLTLVHCTVASNTLSMDQSGVAASCLAPSIAFVVGETYQYSITWNGFGGADDLILRTGTPGSPVQLISASINDTGSATVYAGTFTVTSNATGLHIKDPTNVGGDVTAMSLKKQLT